MTNPKIVAVTEDGIELPALPWSDDPKHALGRRAMDEDASRGVALYIKMVGLLELHQFCQKSKCRRKKQCCGARLLKSGPRQGLYDGFPPCFGTLSEPIREIAQTELRADLRAELRADLLTDLKAEAGPEQKEHK